MSFRPVNDKTLAGINRDTRQRGPKLLSSETYIDYKRFGIRIDFVGRISIIYPNGKVLGLSSSIEQAKKDIDILTEGGFTF